eukprot:4582135-Amphidinium_carterae.1
MVEEKEKELQRQREEVDGLQRRLSDQSQAAEQARTSAEGTYQQERLQFQRQIDEARAEGAELVQRLNAEHQAKLTEIHEKYREELEKLRDSLSTSHGAQLEELRQKHLQEVDGLKTKHSGALKEAMDSKESYERQMEAKSALQAELEDLRRKLLAEKERHQATVEEKEKEVQRQREEMDALQRRLSDQSQAAEEARTSAEGSYQKERLQLLRQIDEARTEGVEMVQRLSAEHQTKLTEVYDKHREQLEKLRDSM